MKPTKSNQKTEVSILSRINVGPIPSAEELARYESIKPGFADRILKMAEKEQEERINLNKKIIVNQHEQEIEEIKVYKKGYMYSLFSIIIIVLLCSYGFFLGYAIESTIIATSVIVALVTVYLKRIKNAKF